MAEVEKRKRKCPAVGWVKRLGVGAFLFFLIKGLLWLIIPGLIAYFSIS